VLFDLFKRGLALTEPHQHYVCWLSNKRLFIFGVNRASQQILWSTSIYL